MSFLLLFLAGCSASLTLEDDDEEEEEEGLSDTRGWSAGSASERLVRCVRNPPSPSSFLSALRSLDVDLQIFIIMGEKRIIDTVGIIT